MPADTRQPTLRPFLSSRRFSMAVPEKTPETIDGSAPSRVAPHCPRPSSVDAISPRDSSSGVVCAFPTTNSPLPPTTKQSVIVPPAS